MPKKPKKPKKSKTMPATLQESYNTGEDNQDAFFGINWAAQTFTTLSAYDISSVKVKVYRTGSPGTVTCHLRDTTGGKPSGPDRAIGTTQGNDFGTDGGGTWVEITFNTSYSLSSGVMYAIVLDNASGVAANRGNWKKDASGPTYTGGANQYSSNSGVDWTTYTAADNMFETWGEGKTYSELAGTIAAVSDVSGNLDTTLVSTLSGTIAAVSTVSGNLGSTTVAIDVTTSYIKRLVVAGKDSIYYESV